MLGGKKKEEKIFPISLSTKTAITFDENFSFSVTPTKNENSQCFYEISDIKGDYELVSIFAGRQLIKLEKGQKTFGIVLPKNDTFNVSFTVLKNFEYKKVYYYNLVVPENQLRCLDLCEYFETEVILAENLKFKYYIKRNAESKFEVHIPNPGKIEIRKSGFFCVYIEITDLPPAKIGPRSETEGTTDDFHEEITYNGANLHFSFVLPDPQYAIL